MGFQTLSKIPIIEKMIVEKINNNDSNAANNNLKCKKKIIIISKKKGKIFPVQWTTILQSQKTFHCVLWVQCIFLSRKFLSSRKHIIMTSNNNNS